MNNIEFPSSDPVIIPDTGRIGQRDILPQAVKSRILGLKTYEAVIDQNGLGDYKTIQDALDAGKRTLFVRNGTYYITSQITLVSGVKIIGENRDRTILDNTGNVQYIMQGANTVTYSTGTVAVTNASTTVTGTGTLWNGTLLAGHYIYIEGNVYEISSVTNDTTLVLTKQYEGRTASGLSYSAGNFLSDVQVSNLTMKVYDHATILEEGIALDGIINSIFNDIFIQGQTTGAAQTPYGLDITDAFNNTFSDIIIRSCKKGLLCTRAYSNILYSVQTHNCNIRAIEFLNAYDNVMSYFNVNSNGDGIRLDTSDYNVFTGLHAISNAAYGIYLANADYNVFTKSVIINNEYGITISNANCDKNIVDSCMVRLNNTSQIANSGTSTVLGDNVTT